MNEPHDTTTRNAQFEADWQVPAFTLQELQPKQHDYCVCIPVINEGERLLNQLHTMHALGLHHRVDVLIADGGSTDGSTAPEQLAALGVRAILTKTGPGKLSAQLRMGFAYALQQGYRGIITVDGNGKDGVEAIPQFVRELETGLDFVQGSRYVAGGQAINTPLIRTLAINLLHAPLINLAARYKYTDTTNGFRAFSRKYLLHPRVQPFRDVFSTYELLAYLSVRASQLGLRTKEIPVVRRYPSSGKTPTKISHFRGNFLLLAILWKTLRGAFNVTTS
jgi:glycosyltransferase involved in cell wall biosynthesis